jgi:hypothetical protein
LAQLEKGREGGAQLELRGRGTAVSTEDPLAQLEKWHCSLYKRPLGSTREGEGDVQLDLRERGTAVSTEDPLAQLEKGREGGAQLELRGRGTAVSTEDPLAQLEKGREGWSWHCSLYRRPFGSTREGEGGMELALSLQKTLWLNNWRGTAVSTKDPLAQLEKGREGWSWHCSLYRRPLGWRRSIGAGTAVSIEEEP